MADLIRSIDGSIDIRQLFTVLSWVICSLLAYMNAGGILPFFIALRPVRISKTKTGVELTAVDAFAMFCSGFVLWPAPALLLPWGTKPALIAAAASLLIWTGSRLTVSVSPNKTRVVRKAAFLIPWSWRSYRNRPQAFTDGWGDCFDPESINIDLGDGRRRIELAWGDKHSGTRCDDLATEFNDAVGKLCC
jgi:hypothetical protein